jgi:hypothetical protein
VTKVLVLYYSSYGHIERMAQAVAEGAGEAGAYVDIKRVPELVPEEVAKKSGFKLDQAAPIATVAELAEYDAIIFGSGTRLMPALGDGRSCGKGRLGVHQLRDSARGPRIDRPNYDTNSNAPRHGRRWATLCVPGSIPP